MSIYIFNSFLKAFFASNILVLGKSIDNKNMITDVQAIVNIVAGTASLPQVYEETVYTASTCPKCRSTYWGLLKDKHEYLHKYPHCPRCGHKLKLDDITEDRDVIGAVVTFIQKNDAAHAEFKLTHKAVETKNIKQVIQKVDMAKSDLWKSTYSITKTKSSFHLFFFHTNISKQMIDIMTIFLDRIWEEAKKHI